MTPRHFDVLGRGPHLIMELGLDLINLVASVELLASRSEVALHEVDVLLVVTHIDSRVAKEDDSEVVEALGHFLAFGEGCLRWTLTVGSLKVELKINHWHCLKLQLLSRVARSGFASVLALEGCRLGGFIAVRDRSLL